MSRLQKAPVKPMLGLADPPAAPGLVVSAGERGPTFFPGQDPVQEGRAAAGALKPPKKKKQGGYNAYPEDVDRWRAAWAHTRLLPGGFKSWSDFQVAAIRLLAEHMEAQHNGGRPWEPLPPGEVASGRPAGS